ncbi:2-methylcitrate dehydratase PrpD [Halogranum amylolyticum]|uniref:2-methylcitrate dehydratase PrpD n=1 Tax=Halogranum amylolyticum TaxID=660520 RepID=A0A1H8MUF5_9EURY|nr:MmgE/PrpD family protein [Halogranum amylolyticum]SEO21025.1 2-methylcitrate dehydratase PrpD [Halogranum amylolyticum]
MNTERAVAFARSATVADAPDDVDAHVRARVLDTLAAVTAGYRQEGVDVVREYATTRLDGAETAQATLLDGSGETVSVEGAALANGVAANALDVDDGHREVKGHPAAVVVPPALAAAEAVDASVGEFLDAVLVGYELAVRAGLAIHAVDGVYTGTGSWGAVGAAAATARLFEFSAEQTAHALGVAEYHAPRTPIMRGVERPGMTKDGIGWGAYVGVVAAQLAEAGFTGSGTVFDESSVDDSLGEAYHVTEGYLKPYPCCRWAQPGVEAVLNLRSRDGVDPASVESVRVATFEEATKLQTRRPETPEEAQYSYPYPVAAALVRGQFTQAEHAASARTDAATLSLAERVEFVVDDELDARFPSECLARVTVETAEGTYRSDVTRGRGARDAPLSAGERLQKARRLVTPTLPTSAVGRIDDALGRESASVGELLEEW